MKYKIKDYPDLYEKVQNMDIDELIYTVVCPNVSNDNPDVKINKNTAAVFYHANDDKTLKERMAAVNEGRDFPALVVTDVESGAGFLEHGTTFPSLRACACADSEELAYKMGEISVRECSKLGFQWGFGPCVDILGDPQNPIVLNRCPGSDPDKVLRIGKAVMQGMQDNGMIAAAKHFPGDGYSSYDQHLTTTVNPLPFPEWKETFGKVYQGLIDAGVKSIMPGHISLPSYDDIDPETGIYRPATLSKKLLTDLLKNELGFEGIIVSDAINMGGFCGYMERAKACATFLECGGDLLLFLNPDEEFLAKMHQFIDEGYLKKETLMDRAYRVLCFAREHENCVKDMDCDMEYHQEIADKITKSAIVVDRDRFNILPFEIKEGSRILYNILSVRGKADFDDDMVNELKKLNADVDIIEDAGPDGISNKIKEGNYDLVISSVRPIVSYGIGSARFCGTIARNMMCGWQKFGTPVIFVTHTSCFKDEYEAVADTVINTHGYAKNTAKYVIEKIIGK